jgi:hypothetical protein
MIAVDGTSRISGDREVVEITRKEDACLRTNTV